MDKVIVASVRGLLCVLTLAGLAACGSERVDSGASAASRLQPQTPAPLVHTPPVAHPTQPTTPPVQPSIPKNPPALEAPSDPVDPPSPDVNAAPQISGSPAHEVVVGQAFNFTPHASDADGDSLSFSIASKPSWASFEASTGRLFGTPDSADTGSHEDIQITVSDGEHTRALAQFAINVVEQTDGSATLAWEPPTLNTDGSALTNLKGYKIHYGTSAGAYDHFVSVNNAGLSSYVIENLAPGTYFFAVSAINTAGAESDVSGEASKTI
jgi:Putative Ig domain